MHVLLLRRLPKPQRRRLAVSSNSPVSLVQNQTEGALRRGVALDGRGAEVLGGGDGGGGEGPEAVEVGEAEEVGGLGGAGVRFVREAFEVGVVEVGGGGDGEGGGEGEVLVEEVFGYCEGLGGGYMRCCFGGRYGWGQGCFLAACLGGGELLERVIGVGVGVSSGPWRYDEKEEEGESETRFS